MPIARSLVCDCSNFVFLFSKPNLGNARVTDKRANVLSFILFKCLKFKAMREQIFKKMLKLSGLRNKMYATYWRPCLNCENDTWLVCYSNLNSVRTWDYILSLSVPCVPPVWWLQLNFFWILFCLFVFIKYEHVFVCMLLLLMMA